MVKGSSNCLTGRLGMSDSSVPFMGMHSKGVHGGKIPCFVDGKSYSDSVMDGISPCTASFMLKVRGDGEYFEW